MNNNNDIKINNPIFNIGVMGVVSDGKSTLVEKLTSIKTQRHTQEKIRNITIKQGYANMKIWDKEGTFYTTNSDYISENKLVNFISFVDTPGHNSLINTLLASVNLMNGVIIVIAVDQPLSMKQQLLQHLCIVKLSKLDKIIICLNKIDLVKKQVVLERKNELDLLLKKYDIKPYIIIPTCFNKKIGLNYVINSIMTLFNPEERNENEGHPLFVISRSFDINRPGMTFDNIEGGVIGGTVLSGSFNINDNIEIRPGRISNIDGKISCNPIKTKIMSIKSDKIELETASSGSLIAFKTEIDPYYTKNDSLIGNVVGFSEKLPNIFININLDIEITTLFDYKFDIKNNDIITLQIGTRVIDGKIIKIGKTYNILLTKPTCISDKQHIIVCKNIDKVLRIVGDGFFNYKINKEYLL